jgi:hypothetical protein
MDITSAIINGNGNPCIESQETMSRSRILKVDTRCEEHRAMKKKDERQERKKEET